MKTKYEIELTINDTTDKGQMEIYDNEIIFYVDDKTRNIMFDNIQNNIIENNILKITLLDKTDIYIKTASIEMINSFIKLQRESDTNNPITYLTSSQRFMKIYIVTFISIFIIIMLLTLDDFNFIGALFGSLFPSLFIAYLVHAFIGHKNNVFANCPHCQKKIFINDVDAQGHKFSLILKGIVGIFRCYLCGNMVGMKHDHLYKLTSQNESEFKNKIDRKQTDNTNNKNILDDNDFNKLEKLKELLDKKIITQEDYDCKKKEILEKM